MSIGIARCSQIILAMPDNTIWILDFDWADKLGMQHIQDNGYNYTVWVDEDVKYLSVEHDLYEIKKIKGKKIDCITTIWR